MSVVDNEDNMSVLFNYLTTLRANRHGITLTFWTCKVDQLFS